MENDEEEMNMETQTAQQTEVAPTENEAVLSELHQPIWSVVSFEEVIKNGLTYDEALNEMERLISEKVSGLCIITDEASARL